MFAQQHHRTYELGTVSLQSGATLKSAQLAYVTHGTLNSAGDNVVLLPTFYTGTHMRNEPLFGPGRAIDPARHFVVSINLFGNGYSSSPSNTDPPQDGPRFPHITLFDNIACQHRLVTECLGIRRIALVLGWSMAAMQAYQWAAQYPDMVDAILPYCGSARCSPHQSCLPRWSQGGVQADAAWRGRLRTSPEKGLEPSAASTSPGHTRMTFETASTAARFRHPGRLRPRLGRGPSQMGCQRSPRQDLDLAAWRHQRQRNLSDDFKGALYSPSGRGRS